MKLKKTVALGLCLLLVMSLFSSSLAYAAETNEVEPTSETEIETNSQEEAGEPFHIWGTFSEAQFAYGPSWTYGVIGYDAAGGYFLCYREKMDGSFYYFGCYSL